MQGYEQTGTVFGTITGKQFVSLVFVEPTIRVINAFSTSVLPVDAQVRSNSLGQLVLAEQRNTVLPKLLPGRATHKIKVG